MSDDDAIYEELKRVAARGATTTYGELAPAANLDMANPQDRGRISRILGDISKREHEQGRPLLSAVVVRKDSPLPGRGFFDLAKELGLHTNADDSAFFEAELARVRREWKGATTTPVPPRTTNDNTTLTPRTSFDTPALEFDFPGFQIGVAEYDEGPTGCTVIRFDRGSMSFADVRGGSPGVYMPDAGACHAICFAGGSLLGLEACAGVAAELFAIRGYKTGWMNIPCVQGAIIFDMPGPSAVYPDKELGRAAVRTARAGWFPLGPRGAGRNARVGKVFGAGMMEFAGQGAAFAQHGDTRVLVITVVNAIGAIVDRNGAVVRGNRRADGVRVRTESQIPAPAAPPEATPAAGSANTTLTAVVTNQRVSQRDLQQLARQVHASMARAIQPFHTVNDGDTLFAVTTSDVKNDALDPTTLGVIASELAWDAVLTSFDPATP